MSIIITQISKYGIVFGTDSNITNGISVVKEDKKIFEIPKLHAAVCTAGTYSVNNMILSKWMPEFVFGKEHEYNSLKEFAELLKTSIDANLNEKERKALFNAHLSGYENNHPEMWHITNSTMPNGDYRESNFTVSEDFWARDWKAMSLDRVFESNGLNYMIYANGFTPGRVAFNVIRQYVDSFFITMWQQKDFRFTPPKNLKGQEELVKSYIYILNSLFEISSYEPKVIGGSVNTFVIPRPQKTL